MILCYEKGKLKEKKSCREALHLESEVSPVISITGAGGKTTTALRLAWEYKEAGNPAIVTTSTHLEIWKQPWFLLEESMEKLEKIRKTEGQVWVGIPLEKSLISEENVSFQKMKAVSEAFLRKICAMHVPVIIEADGARRMPCKVPAEHEPVIVSQTTFVCTVYGIDAVGQRICDGCFRAELTAQMLQKRITDVLEAEDLAKIMVNKQGGRKGIPSNVEQCFILNKAEDDRNLEVAEKVCRELEKYGDVPVLVRSSDIEERAENYR